MVLLLRSGLQGPVRFGCTKLGAGQVDGSGCARAWCTAFGNGGYYGRTVEAEEKFNRPVNCFGGGNLNTVQRRRSAGDASQLTLVAVSKSFIKAPPNWHKKLGQDPLSVPSYWFGGCYNK